MKIAEKRAATAIVALLVAVFITSCASTGSQAPPAASHKGFLEGYYQYLEPGPEGGARMRWAKPGVDFGRYDKIMLDSVIFYFAEDSESKGIDAHEMKELADKCNLALVNAFKGAYPVVGQPGPDVIRIRFAITDVKQSRPALSVASTVIPVGIGVSVLKKGATGSWSGSGATRIEVMALDSMSNEVIGVAQDEKAAGFTERFSKWGSTEEAFEFWGERLRAIMDNTRAK
jgi:hypothetical protein